MKFTKIDGFWIYEEDKLTITNEDEIANMMINEGKKILRGKNET